MRIQLQKIFNNPFINNINPPNNFSYPPNQYLTGNNIPNNFPIFPPQPFLFYNPYYFNPNNQLPLQPFFPSMNNNNNSMNNNNNNNISNIQNNITINNNNNNPHKKIKLRPISANISRLTSNTKESSRISNASYSLYHNSTIEYKPYTLKDYKELEKVGVVLGGLGPNIGTKEWEEKKKKMKKMEEYGNKINFKKNKINKKNFEKIIEEEKKKELKQVLEIDA